MQSRYLVKQKVQSASQSPVFYGAIGPLGFKQIRAEAASLMDNDTKVAD